MRGKVRFAERGSSLYFGRQPRCGFVVGESLGLAGCRWRGLVGHDGFEAGMINTLLI